MKILMNPSWQAKAVPLWPEVSSSLWGRCENINLLKCHSMHTACIPAKVSIPKNVDCHKNFAVQMQKKKKFTSTFTVMVLKSLFNTCTCSTQAEKFFSEPETVHVPTSGRELVLNGVRATFALGSRKAHFWRQAGYPVFLPTPQLSNCS